MTIYLDVVFLENVFMNFIIIFATGIVVKESIKQWRILLAGAVGAFYTIAMYLQVFPLFSNFLLKMLLSVAIMYIAFVPRNVKRLIKDLIIFYLVSFVFGRLRVCTNVLY